MGTQNIRWFEVFQRNESDGSTFTIFSSTNKDKAIRFALDELEKGNRVFLDEWEVRDGMPIPIREYDLDEIRTQEAQR